MAEIFYMRKWKITVDFYRGTSMEFEDLKITFKVEKVIGRPYQFAEVVLYNLNAQTETDIFQNGHMVRIEAGYENGPFGLIFQGVIRQPARGKENETDYYLKLMCVDGDDPLNLGFCNFTAAAGQTQKDIAQMVARSSTVPFDIRFSGELSQQKTSRGKAVFGKPGDVLRNIAQNNNATFYFENGVANISTLSQAPPSDIPEMNLKTGLIGMPQQIDQGIQIRCLMNPNLRLDSWFHINNRDVNMAELDFGQLLGSSAALIQPLLDRDGVYRIIGINILGDTRGQDWYFDIEALTQKGGLPTMIADPSQSGV